MILVLKPSPCLHNGNEVDDRMGLDEWNNWFKSQVRDSNRSQDIVNLNKLKKNIDNNLAYYEIPAQLACAYLKGHLKGRALDWFEVLGYRVIEDKATDYVHLKKTLSEQFPVVRNRSELETRFYSSSRRRDQQPSDFIYELLKIHKVLKVSDYVRSLFF
ncbi:uncharacterized protein TNCV_4571631 [Trichonephila clavipes]|nr:uncharacterized protein TNCV_4571631 [Trichonephila clavipes]